MNFILSDASLQAYLTALKTLLEGAGDTGLILFTDDLTPTRNTVIGDLNQPTFTGYLAQNITLGTPYRGPDGRWTMALLDVSNICTMAPTPGQSIYGWAIVDDEDTPTAILAAGRFTDAPITIAAVGDGIVVGGLFHLDQTGGTEVSAELEATLET